jgi:hypothetical protein
MGRHRQRKCLSYIHRGDASTSRRRRRNVLDIARRGMWQRKSQQPFERLSRTTSERTEQSEQNASSTTHLKGHPQ